MELIYLEGKQEDVLLSIISFLKEHVKSLQEIWLFGSRARGDFKEKSDWDLALLVQEKFLKRACLKASLIESKSKLEEKWKIDLNVQVFSMSRFYHVKRIKSKKLQEAIHVQLTTLQRCAGWRGKIGLRRIEFRLRIIKGEGCIIYQKEGQHDGVHV